MAIRLLSNETIDGTGGFTGDVTIGGKTYPKLNLTDNQGVARNFSVGTNNETFTVRNETGSSDAFTISNTNIATFTSTVITENIFQVYSTGASVVIGAVGNTANDINIYSTSSGHNGLRMHVNGILPTDNTGTIINNDADLGDPSYRFRNLYIGSTADVDSTIYTGESLRFNGTGLNATDKKLYSPTDGELQWFTHDLAGAHAFSVSHQGTRRVYLNTSGDSYFTGGEVGIGTASPTNMLSIQGSSGSSKGLEIFHSNGNKVAELIHNGSGDEGMLRLLDSNSETVRIAGETNIDSYINSGNVGIGTATPSAKLEVNGDILVTGVYDTVYNDTSVAQQWYKFYEKTGAAGGDLLHFALLTVNNAEFMAEVRIFVPTYAGFSSGYGNLSNGQGAQVEIRMGGLNSQYNILEAIDEVANLGSTSDFLELYLRIDPVYSNTEVRVINYPDATVHFSTSGTWTTTDPRTGLSTRSFPFYNANTTFNNILNITSNNSVGIGTSSPNLSSSGTALTVNSSSGANAAVEISDGGTLAGLLWGRSGTGVNVWSIPNIPLIFGVNNAEKMRIKATATPQLRIGDGDNEQLAAIRLGGENAGGGRLYFEYNGDNSYIDSYGGHGSTQRYRDLTIGARNLSLLTGNTSGGTRMYIDVNGNVGIGTTSPSSKLDVVGSNTSSNPLVELTASGTGQWQRGVRLLNGGMAAGSSIMYALGYADNSRNMGQTYFYYAGSGSTSNRISMGLHSVDDVLNVCGTGNVGIGNTSPSGKLHIGSGSSLLLSGSADELILDGAGNSGMTIGSGTSGVGSVFFADSGSSASGYVQYNHSSNALIMGTQATERMRIDSSGNVGIGTTSPSSKLHVVGTGTQARFQSSSSYSDILFTNSSGTGGFLNFGGTTAFNVYVGGGSASNLEMSLSNTGNLTVSGDVVAYGSPSDIRLKENIKPVEKALDKVIKLNGVSFDWKDKEDALDREGNPVKLKKWKKDIGFIAQEVQEVIPELVRENEEGMLSVRHQGIIPVLVEAIKELKAEIEELKKSK